MKNYISRSEVLDDLKTLIQHDVLYQSSIYLDRQGFNEIDVCQLPITNMFLALHDYTYNLKWDFMGGNATDISCICEHARAFLDRITALENNDFSDYTETDELLCVTDKNVGGNGLLCRKITLAACARAKLEGRWDGVELNVNEIAAYADIYRNSVKIGLREQTKEPMNFDFIDIDIALKWVKTRDKNKKYQEAKYIDSVDDIDPFFFEDVNAEIYFLDRGGKKETIKRVLCGDFSAINKLSKETKISAYWITSRLVHLIEDNNKYDEQESTMTYLKYFNLCAIERFKHEDRVNELEKVRVPVAKDGSIFHPGLRLGKGYQIGQRNHDQRYVDDYWDALKELEKMPTPRFRRPSQTSGVPGTVIATEWKTISKKELLSMEGKN